MAPPYARPVTRVRPGVTALAAVLALGGCGHGKPPPAFNAVRTAPATAPASPEFVPAAGGSRVTITGEVELETTQDFTCSYAVDDFFVRGELARYQGVPVYLSINVEFYKRPGTYPKRTQVLLRRVSEDSSTYASWYESGATGTVRPNSGGTDLQRVTLQPERGTQATRPLTIEGHFACATKAKPGPG